MKCLFMATVDTSTGDYEVEFRNLDQPGEGMDYDHIKLALGKVLCDLDSRLQEIRQEAGNIESVHVFGDDQTLQ